MIQVSNTLTVRSADVSDIQALAEIHHASWIHSVGSQFSGEILARKTIEYRIDQWTSAIGDNHSPAPLVAETDGKVIGLVATKLESPGVGEIEKLYVDPAFLGKGAGSALLSCAIDQLTGLGCHQAVLWVNELNLDAQEFYEKQGWWFDGGTGQQAVPETEEFVSVIRYRRSLDPVVK